MSDLIKNLEAVVGRENVLSSPDELLVYECDGLPQHKHRPRAVVFPSTTEQTAAIMRELTLARVPFTPRGAGTGLSGGALALNEGVVIEMARMRQIIKIDPVGRIAVVQPGVVNLQVSRAAAPFGLYYVPDPSSQPTCTIGGNIAESAGGIHCLKYGTTTDHVLGCRVVLAGGEIVDLGGAGVEDPGYDLLGTFIGSEGTFGIATEATLRLVQTPPAVRTLLAEFGEVNDASHAVSAIIAAGVMPAALEMMDREIIRAVEASVFAAGLPPDAGAALLIELDGIEAGLDEEAERVTSICMEYGARSCRRATDETERKKLWAARKGAFGAIGRISPDSMIQDAVVPRSRLPEVLDAAYAIAAKYQLRIANVFHAGDGNLHPLICFDARFPDEVRRVKEAGRELMEVCVSAGGTITGEHGVGLDKRELLPLVFSDDDLNAMLRVRAAFDPNGICNPGKIVPMLRGCGEASSIAKSTSLPQPTPLRPLFSNVDPQPIAATAFRPNTAVQQLAKLISENRLSLLESEKLTTPPLVVSPASIEEVSEVMKLAASERWTVMPAGGMTWLHLDDRETPNLIVSTARLNKIVEHEPADLVAVAQTGVKLSDFNEILSRNGQWLPLDPPDNGRATIGGVVSTGLGGAQQFGYGRPRGSVIGMQVVLADGTVVKAGGKVVKNVAGYDLCKLFTGSYGSLGIITEVNFKLRPRPQREATVLASGAKGALLSAARSILDSKLFPVAVQLISSRLANLVGVDSQSPAVLLVRFAGNKPGVAFQTEEALFEIGKSAAHPETVVDDAAVWKKLNAAPLNEQAVWCWRASVKPSEVERFIETVAKLYDSDFAGSLWQLDVACGTIRMLDDLIHDSRFVQELARLARSAGGSLFIESSEADAEFLSDNPRSARDLADRIKQQLDPLGILRSSWFDCREKAVELGSY
jgi:glycolate oxidase subunit GlcD